ncbi:hypothetical protein [Dactylosporangium matsuzakiense]|uniref:Uncharacterized protein n=1 Tax=Dactylosporangium matsuzakiense TaxID=53360 RepID=A0A9W6KSZ7_9ACTN|nr:hypothetical protein [Dactylosporangium matsuzakiense]UWZ48340.1 hypothetical protein Dmats_19180 [Dactylosporangium matsuzakiense]GLL07621.1 hypothetical protein GCM10017581_093750 [Dactylosporangium matsuzakiense]
MNTHQPPYRPSHWPAADVDQITRLRALAAGVTGAVVTERLIDAEFATVWALLSDFEGSFGLIEPDMRHVRVAVGDGEHIELQARSRAGFRARLVGTHRPGWLWVQSRFLLIGVAAVAQPRGGTRVALTGGVRVPGRAALVPIGVRRAARGALDRLQRQLGTG